MGAADGAASGFEYASFEFRHESGSNFDIYIDDSGSGSSELSPFAASGTWTLFAINYTDFAGNSIFVNADENLDQFAAFTLNNQIQTSFEVDYQGFSASIPLQENALPGAIIGSLTGIDPDWSSGLTYSLAQGDGINDAHNSFVEIIDNLVVIAQGADVNFEVNPVLRIFLEVSDGELSYQQSFAIDVLNLDEIAPAITSGATATAIVENSGAAQVVYTATSDDSSDISGGVSYSIKPATGDGEAFSIDSSTGVVTLIGNPDFESKPSYSFTVVATDAAGNSSEQTVALAINNLDAVSDTHRTLPTRAGRGRSRGAPEL